MAKEKEELTPDELTILVNLVANAQVPVKDALVAMQLLEKLKRMLQKSAVPVSE